MTDQDKSLLRGVPSHVAGESSAGVGTVLTAQNVSAVLRKVGQWIGLDKEEWEKISGHSCRVGAAQDLLALNISLASVMQTGRWKDTRMPMRYAERVLATRGGMEQAAKDQGKLGKIGALPQGSGNGNAGVSPSFREASKSHVFLLAVVERGQGESHATNARTGVRAGPQRTRDGEASRPNGPADEE